MPFVAVPGALPHALSRPRSLRSRERSGRTLTEPAAGKRTHVTDQRVNDPRHAQRGCKQDRVSISPSSSTWVEPASLPKALPTKTAPGTFSQKRLPECGRVAVTSVRMSSPRMMVVCPTYRPATSVIASSGPVGRTPTFSPKSEARGRALGVWS